jgi:hypothetical protein
VTDQSIIRAVETQWPEVWAKCYPRVYDDACIGNYHSPRSIAWTLAGNILARFTALAHPETDSMQASAYDFILANHFAKFGCQTFFLSRGIFEAMEHTKPPVSIEWHEMQLPYESAAFMLPKGALTHPEDGDCAYLAYARLKFGELHESPFPLLHQYGIVNGGFLIYAGTARGRQYHYHWPYTPAPSDPDQRFFRTIYLGDLEEAMSHGSDDTSRFFFPEGMTDGDNLFVRKVAHYIFSSIMLMLARPELVERGSLKKRVEKPGKPVREYWTPNVIGGRYKVARERAAAAGGTHASPRGHWRRGHWRQQAHGEKHSLRREVWIEPVFVGE